MDFRFFTSEKLEVSEIDAVIGIVNDVRLLQYSKAEPFIEVTESGMTTFFILFSFLNALLLIVVTGKPLYSSAISISSPIPLNPTTKYSSPFNS